MWRCNFTLYESCFCQLRLLSGVCLCAHCESQQQSPVEQRYKELLALRDEYLKKLEELQRSDSSPSSRLTNSPAPNTSSSTTPPQQYTHLQTPLWGLVTNTEALNILVDLHLLSSSLWFLSVSHAGNKLVLSFIVWLVLSLTVDNKEC